MKRTFRQPSQSPSRVQVARRPAAMASLLAAFPLIALLLLIVLGASTADAQNSLRIGPRDQIQIRVSELPNLDSELTVAEDGTIELSVIGSVVAAGLNESELAQRLRERLEQEGLRRATVSVKVTAFKSRPVSILGAVNQPGNHYVPGRTTLLELLLDAGGLSENHGDTIHVRRRADNGLSDQIQISVEALIRDGDPVVNIPILAGDLINIPTARDIEIFFIGEIQNPGSLVFRSTEPVTLLTAIARAGGITDLASRKLRIKRGTGKKNTEEILVDYRQVLNGQIEDPQLQDGDIIIVKESFF